MRPNKNFKPIDTLFLICLRTVVSHVQITKPINESKGRPDSNVAHLKWNVHLTNGSIIQNSLVKLGILNIKTIIIA